MEIQYFLTSIVDRFIDVEVVDPTGPRSSNSENARGRCINCFFTESILKAIILIRIWTEESQRELEELVKQTGEVLRVHQEAVLILDQVNQPAKSLLGLQTCIFKLLLQTVQML